MRDAAHAVACHHLPGGGEVKIISSEPAFSRLSGCCFRRFEEQVVFGIAALPSNSAESRLKPAANICINYNHHLKMRGKQQHERMWPHRFCQSNEHCLHCHSHKKKLDLIAGEEFRKRTRRL